jgi:hypothetical protein
MRVWEAVPRVKVDETQSGNNLKIRLRRLNRGYSDRNLIYSPKFPKPQQESWFALAVDPTSQRILGLQRLTLSGRSGGEGSTDLRISDRFNGASLVVRILSDGWRGVDVEKTIKWRNSEDTVDT